MKNKKLLTLITSLLLVGGIVTGCGDNQETSQNSDKIQLNISGPTSVEVGSSIRLAVSVENDNERLGYSLESSDTTIATVTNDGYVTGVRTGTVTITATSRKDDTIKMEYVVDVIESTTPTLSISTTTPSMTLSNNGGTALFKANLYNPNNFTVKYEWSSKYGKGTFIGNGKEQQQYRPFYAGTDVIVLDAYVGPYHLKEEFNFLVKSDYTGWTAISTADELIDLVTNAKGANNLTENYYLTNDIDLNGYVISPSKRKAGTNKLASSFDGRGHKISNFIVEGDAGGTNGGLFDGISNTGAVRNLSLVCEIGEGGSGWGTGTISPNNDGVIENCYFEVNHSFDTGKKADENGYVPFCAAVTGMTNGKTRDVVVNVLDTEGKATIYADHAYPAGGQNGTDQPAKVENFYTNHTAIGGQAWDWGYAILDQSGYTTGIDFATAKKDTYNLNSLLWTINDGEIPTLIVQE